MTKAASGAAGAALAFFIGNKALNGSPSAEEASAGEPAAKPARRRRCYIEGGGAGAGASGAGSAGAGPAPMW
jgi:hypothetical protein